MRGYVVLAGLALLAAASAEQRRRHRVPLNPLDQAKEEDVLPPAHVGSGDFKWELADRFADLEAFQRALRELGYEVKVDGNVLSEESIAAVNAFQLDWNVAAQAFELGDPVETTGYIDAGTVQALVSALDATATFNVEWFNLVGEALNLLRPEVG